MSERNLEGMFTERRDFIQRIGLIGHSFIEIRDFTELHHISREAFRRLKQGVLLQTLDDESERPMACFMIRFPRITRWLLRFFTRPHSAPFLMEYRNHRRDAILRGLNLLYEKRVLSYAKFERIEQREFLFEYDLYRESVHFIMNDIIYVDTNGVLDEKAGPKRILAWKDFLNHLPKEEKGYSILIGIKEQAPKKADLELMLSSPWIQMLFHRRCERIVILTNREEAGDIAQEILTLGPLSFRIERRFLDALNSLLPQEEESRARPLRPEKEVPYEQELEELESYILNLQVQNKNSQPLILSESLGETHPLRPLYQAVNLCFSKTQDQFDRLKQQNSEISWKYKESVFWSSVYEILFRQQGEDLSAEVLASRFVETFNNVMEKSRASLFKLKDRSYHCILSSQDRSLLGNLIPLDIIETVQRYQILDLSREELSKVAEPQDKLHISPFFQAFFESKKIDRLLIRPLGKEGASDLVLLLDVKEDRGEEAEHLAHLVNTVLSTVRHHLYQKDEEILDEPIMEQPVDWHKAMEEYDHDETFFKQVLGSFLYNLDEQIELMNKAAQEGEHDILRRECHKIKGGAGNLYAKKLQDAALALEELAQRKDSSHYAQGLEEFVYQQGRIHQWFQDKWSSEEL